MKKRTITVDNSFFSKRQAAVKSSSSSSTSSTPSSLDESTVTATSTTSTSTTSTISSTSATSTVSSSNMSNIDSGSSTPTPTTTAPSRGPLSAPYDISQTKDDVPAQPVGTFPFDGTRSFTKLWYNHKWVEYSLTKNAAYCFACRHFGFACVNAWTQEGFQNWKKGPKDHLESKKHIDATAVWETYCSNKVKGETIMSQVSDAHSEIRRVTHEWIKFVSRVLRYCASQDIALRAHRDDGENQGNFMGAVSLVLQHSQELRDFKSHMPQNANYLSPETQNELLHCMASMVRTHIVIKVKEAREARNDTFL